MIPVALDWATVSDAIADFLGNALVLTGIVTVLSLRFAPAVVRAIKKSVTTR